jgi:protein associated with RNAse G/E
MRPIEVFSTKYDGSLHYRYVMQLVRVEPDLAITYVGPGVAVESYRGSMTTTRHTLALFWNNRSYNVHVNWDADWRARSHYVNIATPASWDAAQLRFIDLDLDVIWRTDNSIILDDEDEFAHHTDIFAYPPDLVAESWRSRDEVCSLIERRVYPFDGSLYAWRP